MHLRLHRRMLSESQHRQAHLVMLGRVYKTQEDNRHYNLDAVDYYMASLLQKVYNFNVYDIGKDSQDQDELIAKSDILLLYCGLYELSLTQRLLAAFESITCLILLS